MTREKRVHSGRKGVVLLGGGEADLMFLGLNLFKHIHWIVIMTPHKNGEFQQLRKERKRERKGGGEVEPITARKGP